MPATQRARKKRPACPKALLIRVLEQSGRLHIPGSDYGGPTQDVRAVVMIRSDTLGWIPCPFSWSFVRNPATGDLVVDLSYDVKLGFVALYPAVSKPARKKKRAKKKAVNKAHNSI
jgi:hypothetical protein